MTRFYREAALSSTEKRGRPRVERFPLDDELKLSSLEHMQSLLMEMRRNARTNGFPMLGYLLDMSVIEIKEIRDSLADGQP
ncbi:hypothetical protein [Limoniibacter endophyticus]|uniref:Uncharacterized protein n=1 Tax=Limoniibacter endophyticus TaxID=1565040 RepID=A0A8J3DQ28_9HYPH|nr:hypothetical protein [Limoniibacter endophyticus]GHC79070.1 hypothetical protein GCM10010136_31310 [Limoniibacter endophyticus]